MQLRCPCTRAQSFSCGRPWRGARLAFFLSTPGSRCLRLSTRLHHGGLSRTRTPSMCVPGLAATANAGSAWAASSFVGPARPGVFCGAQWDPVPFGPGRRTRRTRGPRPQTKFAPACGAPWQLMRVSSKWLRQSCSRHRPQTLFHEL